MLRKEEFAIDDSVLDNTINITQTVKETVNELCDSLFSSISNTIFPVLDDIVFIDNDITENTHLENLFGTSMSSGVLILANSLVLAFILYYCIKLLISFLSGQPVDHPYRFILKTILIVIVMNYSLSICTYAINATSTLSTFFCELGNEIFGKKISFITLVNELKKTLNDSFNMFSLNGFLASTLYLSSFSLALNFGLRYILIKVLIILSPFAILCCLNQSTEPIFKSWCKAFISSLFLQVFVAIILLLPFSIMKDNSDSLFNELLMVGAITALLKSNQFVRELIGGLGITTNFQSGLVGLKNLFTN